MPLSQKMKSKLTKKEKKWAEDMTATAITLQREAENKSRMDCLMAKALLTGTIDSRIIRWAEQLVYVYEKMMEEEK